MGISLKICILLGSLAVFVSVFKSIKQHKLHPSFAVLWIFVALFLASIAVLESVYAYVAKEIFGLYGGDHLIYVGLLFFLLTYVYYLTVRICQMSDRVSKLISHAAVVESELQDLKKKLKD